MTQNLLFLVLPHVVWRLAGGASLLHPQYVKERGEAHAVFSKCQSRSDPSLSCSHFIAQNESHEYTQFQTQGMWSDVAGLMWNTCEKTSSAQYKNVEIHEKINVSGIMDPWGMSKKSTQDRLSDVYFTHHKDCFKLWKTVRIKLCLMYTWFALSF